jgi:signal transduction histidine kinase
MKNLRYLFCILSFFLASCTERQGSADVNGSDNALSTTKKQFDSLADIQLSQPDQAIKLLQSIAQKSENRKVPEILMNCYVNSCRIYCQYLKKTESGHAYADSAHALAADHPHLQYRSLFAEGLYQLTMEKYDSATALFLRAAQLTPKDCDSLFIASLYGNISNVHLLQQNPALALKYYQPILDIAQRRQSKPMDALAFVNGYCLACLCHEEELQKNYLYQARKIAGKFKDNGLNAVLFHNVGNYYRDHNQYDSAEHYATLSLQAMDSLHSAMKRPEKNLLLLIEVALKQNDPEKARRIVERLSATTDTASLSIEDKMFLYEFLSEIDEKQAHPERALKHLRSQIALKENFHKEQTTLHLMQLERVKNESDSEKALSAKTQQLKIQNIYLVALSIMAILLALLSLFAYRRWQKNRELLKKETEVLLLRREIDIQNKLLSERNRIAQEMHDDLGSTLSSTMMAITLLKENMQDATALETIDKNAQKLWNQINEVIWSLNTRNDTLKSLQNRIIRHAREFLSQANLSFESREFIEESNLAVSGYKRRKILLITKELLNNIVRHAQATAVVLEIKQNGPILSIRICDNGLGFDPHATASEEREHYGLQNIRNHIEEMGGTIAFNFETGSCITFTVDIP